MASRYQFLALRGCFEEVVASIFTSIILCRKLRKGRGLIWEVLEACERRFERSEEDVLKL